MIQVRNVPDDLHRRLEARADREGASMSELIRRELPRIAGRPSKIEYLEELRQRGPVEWNEVGGPSRTEMIREARAWPQGWTLGEARSGPARVRGLLGRRRLDDHEGLWLPVRSIHTLGMRFAIGLVWLDGQRNVVRVDERVPSGRFRTCLAARGGVVEVAAGRAAALAEGFAVRGSAAGPTTPDRPRGPGCDCASRGR
jgi:uncharacterized membrane protein (UPF0127 family)